MDGQLRLAVDVAEGQRVAGIDQVGVFDLRVGPPQLWPLPGLAQVFAGNVPERVPGNHRVLLWKTIPELHLPLRGASRSQKQQGE